MKLAFSTLGCPEWSWDDMLANAKGLGFHGIEIRGIANELFVPKVRTFSNENVESTMRKLKKLRLEIPCLTSACHLFDKTNIDNTLDDARAYIDLAFRLGTPYVRVLGDEGPQPGKDIDDYFVSITLKILADYAQTKNVKILIETNGVYADSNRMLSLLKIADSSNVGVLWDIHHTYRYMHESVEKTFEKLKPYIEYVHVKDSVVTGNRVSYKMLGSGNIPVEQALKTLKNNGFKGYVTIEWVKRWCMDLEEPGIAFPHYMNYMKKVL